MPTKLQVAPPADEMWLMESTLSTNISTSPHEADQEVYLQIGTTDPSAGIDMEN